MFFHALHNQELGLFTDKITIPKVIPPSLLFWRHHSAWMVLTAGFTILCKMLSTYKSLWFLLMFLFFVCGFVWVWQKNNTQQSKLLIRLMNTDKATRTIIFVPTSWEQWELVANRLAQQKETNKQKNMLVLFCWMKLNTARNLKL